jgi:hypothetical protein
MGRLRGIEHYAHLSRLRRGEWDKWFAWRPVLTERGRLAWLSTVMRCRYSVPHAWGEHKVTSYMGLCEYVSWRWGLTDTHAEV